MRQNSHDISNCGSLLVCEHCNTHGHNMSNFYELVGYLEGRNHQGENEGATGCGKKMSARGIGYGSIRANVVSHGVGVISSTCPGGSHVYTSSTVNHKFDTKFWIIDSGN